MGDIANCGIGKRLFGRLTVAVTVGSLPLLVRLALSARSEPALAVVDVCSLALTWLFWNQARMGRMSLREFRRVGAVIAMTLMVGSAFRVAATSDALETAGVAAILGASATMLASLNVFGSLAAAAGGLWVLAASATLSFQEAWASGAALALVGAFGWCYMERFASRMQPLGAEDAGGAGAGDETQQRLKQALDGGRIAYWHWDLAADRFYVSEQWALDLGCDHATLTGRPDDWLNRIHPYHLAEVRRRLWAHLSGATERFDCEYRVQHRDGTYHWAMVKAAAQRDAKGEAVAIAGVQIDLSALVIRDSSMLDDALKDKLTGLPNRRDFTARVERRFNHYQKNPSALFAVAFFDLDRFEALNESLGHAVGDKLLAAVADRLRASRREGDMMARLGGDEFAALLDNVKDPREVIAAVKHCRAALSSPLRIDNHDLACGVSVGVALCDASVRKADDLIRNADAALHQAKKEKTGENVLFSDEMLSEVTELWQLQNDLSHALERDELQLHYQPIFSLAGGEIVSAEALMRWRRGSTSVSPAVFIPIAEDIGLIESLGAWALRQACMQNAEWRRRGLPPIRIAVNVSSKQLHRPGFVETVGAALADSGLPGEALALELTETALMESLEQTPAALRRLRALGVEVAIDDFGTGYSSLSYLRQFDFQILKIDRSFVDGLVDDPRTAALARGLIGLAHNLGLKVTAEGVETMAQLEFLRLEGCDQIQGFLASRPVDAESFERLASAGMTLDRALKAVQ